MFLTPADLEAFVTIDEAKAEAMIEDAVAMATLAAPCLSTPEFQSDDAKVAAVKAILRGAVLRWNDAGSGALVQHSQTAGPFTNSESYDNRQSRKGMFWPSEIAQLRDLCSTSDDGAAFVVDTAPTGQHGNHSPYCAVVFGASYCSCGAYLTSGEYPLYEGGLYW